MVLTLLVAAVAASLLIGAAWGYALPLPERVEGNLLAFGGGALLSSLVLELFLPAMETAGAGPASLALLAGAAGFAIVDHWVDEVWGGRSGLSGPPCPGAGAAAPGAVCAGPAPDCGSGSAPNPACAGVSRLRFAMTPVLSLCWSGAGPRRKMEMRRGLSLRPAPDPRAARCPPAAA